MKRGSVGKHLIEPHIFGGKMYFAITERDNEYRYHMFRNETVWSEILEQLKDLNVQELFQNEKLTREDFISYFEDTYKLKKNTVANG